MARLAHAAGAACFASIVLSAAASAQPTDFAPFTQVAFSRGINYSVRADFSDGIGYGVAFADLDLDGDPDLLALGAQDRSIGIWENDGTGHFTDRRAGSGLVNGERHSSITAADFDNDGDPDLFVAQHGLPNQLFRNDGGFQFTLLAGTGLEDAGEAHHACWADFDGDGWLDVYICNVSYELSAIQNKLYRNNGDGTFTDLAGTLDVQDPGSPSLVATFFDYDRDGDADLYLGNDRGDITCLYETYLWRNDGGTFTDVTDEMNALVCVHAMGIAVGDMNGDLYPDLYITNEPTANMLLLSDAGGPFTESAGATGTTSDLTGWAAHFADLDQDGVQELLVCNYTALELFWHSGGMACVDIAQQVNLDDFRIAYAAAMADIDGDGDLDFVVSSIFRSLELFINNEGQERSFVKIRIPDPVQPLRESIGAIVDVTAGGTTQTREVVANPGYKSQNELVQHVGLGDAEVVDQITVYWPNGGGSRTLTGYSANETWTVWPDEMLGDADGDGMPTSTDFFAFIDCFVNSPGGVVEPGCEMMDFNGDALFTSDDFFEFIARFLGA